MAEHNAVAEAATQGTPVIEDGDAELAKSIDMLQDLLESDGADEESLEKAAIGTMGGLQAQTPTDGPLDPNLVDEAEEDEGDPEEAVDVENPLTDPTASDLLTSGHAPSPMGFVPGTPGLGTYQPTEPTASNVVMSKGLTDAEGEASDDTFAKSLAAAFSGPTVTDVARGSDFAKSLVLGTIEGLSIAHDEIQKSLGAMESRLSARQDERIDTLAKSLAVALKALSEITKEVKGVAAAPVRPVAKSAQYLAKSFGEGGTPTNTLSKAQVAEALERRVMEKKLDPMALARFESAGIIDPALLAEIQGSGR